MNMQISSSLVLGLLLGALPALKAQVRYSVTDLGVVSAAAMNNAGQVTGYFHTSTGASHAFLYTDGQMIDLGTLGGNNSGGSSINDGGLVTGSSQTSTGDSHAFLYSYGQMIDLGTLGGSTSSGVRINTEGQVTGQSETFFDATHAFLYTGVQMTDLTPWTLDSSTGVSINDAGQVTVGLDGNIFLYSYGDLIQVTTTGSHVAARVGGAINGSGQVTGDFFHGSQFRAFLYSSGQFSPLASPGESAGFAINNAGDVVGYAVVPFGGLTGALWRNGQLQLVGVIGHSNCMASAINNLGQVVGACGPGNRDYPNSVGFIYSDGDFSATDLNNLIDPKLGITISEASMINDRGQIVANSGGHTFLLTPIPTSNP